MFHLLLWHVRSSLIKEPFWSVAYMKQPAAAAQAEWLMAAEERGAGSGERGAGSEERGARSGVFSWER